MMADIYFIFLLFLKGTILAEYVNTLSGLVGSRQLERFLNNTNLRR